MKASAPATLKGLVISVLLYMALALIAGGVAIAEALPAEFAGTRTGLTATQDFLYGMGVQTAREIYTSRME